MNFIVSDDTEIQRRFPRLNILVRDITCPLKRFGFSSAIQICSQKYDISLQWPSIPHSSEEILLFWIHSLDLSNSDLSHVFACGLHHNPYVPVLQSSGPLSYALKIKHCGIRLIYIDRFFF